MNIKIIIIIVAVSGCNTQKDNFDDNLIELYD